MEIVCDQLFQALEYGRMLSEESISGQEHLNYVLEQPERREQKTKRIYDIRGMVAGGKLRDRDRENLLSSTNRELKMLKTGRYIEAEGYGNSGRAAVAGSTDTYAKTALTHLLSFALGVGSGYVLRQVKGDQERKFEDEIKRQTSEAVDAVYGSGRPKQSDRMPKSLIDGITDEMRETRKATEGIEKVMVRLFKKLEERENREKREEVD